MSDSRYCQQEIWTKFESILAAISQNESLVVAAALVAAQNDGECEPERVLNELNELARKVASRTRSQQGQAILAHLHAVLFEELGMHGSREDYYSPHNSYINRVIESRTGLPVLLTLIYKYVGERVGLQIEGVNTPGHFMAAAHVDDEWLLIDPFDRGRMLTTGEATSLIASITGIEQVLTWDVLPIATHQQWLARIIMNLMAIFQQSDDRDAQLAMQEMFELVVRQAANE
jgi:regulator of sirC expression with transglutaminase-like and TPR domain